jgi:hypothetical protein
MDPNEWFETTGLALPPRPAREPKRYRQFRPEGIKVLIISRLQAGGRFNECGEVSYSPSRAAHPDGQSRRSRSALPCAILSLSAGLSGS